MEPGDSMSHSQRLSSNLILSRANPISRIATHFFKFHSNIVSHLGLGLPKGLFPAGLPVKILKEPLLSYVLAT